MLPGSVGATRSVRFCRTRGTSFQILNPSKLSINFPIGYRFGFMNFNDEWRELDFEVDEQPSGLKEIVWDRVWV